VVGRTILATFRISESNRPVGGFDRVDAEVTLTRPDGRTETHPLFDDGTNGDRLAGNHIWSVEISDPVKEPGPYHLRAHFELTHREGTRARVSEYSIVAQPLPEHCTNVVAGGVVNAYMQHRPQPGDIIQLDELVCLFDKCGAPDRYEMQITDSMGWLRTPDPQGTGALINLPRSFRSGSVKGFGEICLGSPDPDDSDGGIPLVAVIPESARPGDRSVVSIRMKSLAHPDQEPVDVETAIEVFPPRDCNQNGVDDAIDIANGTLKDQDHNGIPDACEGGVHYHPAASPYIHVSVADVAERPGNLVEVPILVSDATGLAGGDLVLTYDAEVLTPRRVRTGDLLTSAGIITVVNLQLRGEVRVSMAGATAIRAGAETESNAGDLVGIDVGPVFMEALVTAVFEVHPNAPEGTTPLALQAALKDEKGAAIPFTVQHGSVTVVVGLLGDVNNDQRVDAGDAILVLRHAVRLSALTQEQQKLGDVNKDGKVDAGDAILILRFGVGLIEVFKPLATQPIIEPINVRLADVQRSFDGTLPLTFVLDPVGGAVGGDLLLVYPPTMGRPMDIQVEGLPVEAFLAVNTHTAGQVRVSFAHGDGSLQASQIALHMLLPDAQPSHQLEIDLTGRLYNLRGQPVGEIRLERTTVQVLPSQYALLQNYPNPFNPVTAIRYNLPQRGHVVLTIYSMTGQLVRTLVDDQVEAGHHTIEWDGKNSRGQQVSSGICLYRLVVDGGQYTALRRMVLL
ncbi:MAG TPA: hypothetical protein EYO90_03940, partial [Candidatus Latescibacteria bacterium]|nr:hypothetical protein [Candidatus Latescibacterota bacterium]